MQVTKRSPLTGKMTTREVACTEIQLRRWRSGMTIQSAMPHLSMDDREFLMTGYTPEDWVTMFGPE